MHKMGKTCKNIQKYANMQKETDELFIHYKRERMFQKFDTQNMNLVNMKILKIDRYI